MSEVIPSGGFHTANPHALATILEASETRSIIASSDIFDISGMKLWARNQPVSQDLQRKLMDRALSKPLETCLMAEDGVSSETLRQAVKELIDTEGPLTPLLRAHAAALQRGAAAVRLHSVVQLLLSVVQTARPSSFAHAVQAMAVAGALVHARGADERLVALAMTAGLVHDVGGIYIAPEYGEADVEETLSVESYRQLVVHPHIGQLLLSQLTDYPKDIARAVAEHHEHLDGSGYPHRLTAERISPLGRVLAATEEALAALRAPGSTLHHASVALRVVPGEFDDHLAGPLSAAARSLPPMTAHGSLPELLGQLTRLDMTLQATMNRVETLVPAESGEGLQRAAELTLYMLHKLRQGWNESGLWSPGAIGEEQVAEAEAVQDALRARLAGIERAARLTAGSQLTAEDEDRLDLMCACLTDDMAS
ncbi:MAG TPA: HD domain-containing phosphohydrolase [Aquabacterium sp.]|uniref:HD-GYP domain-containing protein n=1 Tax=Aquabacterium sp. TaxID=1872578 RepID=UPI002E37CEDD|nr:HD domain-containing phosphohydrolase [Aquabacterium sp.]HEX5373525.1 HD domain-containing phosphohydrolase [Aquabacterium sp.]